MRIDELRQAFADASSQFSDEIHLYLKHCPCDDDTRDALDELARQYFYSLTMTQNAVIKYLSEK